MMDLDLIVDLVKETLGIKSTSKETLIRAQTEGVIKELEDEKGLVLDSANPYHLMFCVDYAVFRYQAKDKTGGMPRHLQYRLHNLMLHGGKE